jgi:hypothetical protein
MQMLHDNVIPNCSETLPPYRDGSEKFQRDCLLNRSLLNLTLAMGPFFICGLGSVTSPFSRLNLTREGFECNRLF